MFESDNDDGNDDEQHIKSGKFVEWRKKFVTTYDQINKRKKEEEVDWTYKKYNDANAIMLMDEI